VANLMWFKPENLRMVIHEFSFAFYQGPGHAHLSTRSGQVQIYRFSRCISIQDQVQVQF
jgi:hypothetical protein